MLQTSPLRITIATDARSWLADRVPKFVEVLNGLGHQVQLVHHAHSIPQGDLLFLLSFWEIVSADTLQRNRNNLVVHESPLPAGRGWSPVTWQILEGKNEIPVALLEAGTKCDAGPIYLTGKIRLAGHELIDEIRTQQARVTFDLCEKFVSRYPDITNNAKQQKGDPTVYPRRGPEDSRLSINKTIAEQFNLLRVVDNHQYPAFFDMHGCRYRLKVEKLDNENAGN